MNKKSLFDDLQVVKKEIIKIPESLDVNIKDLHLLNEIMFNENLLSLRLKISDVYRMDKVVDALKMDTNRDKYFFNSRATLQHLEQSIDYEMDYNTYGNH